MKTKVDSKRFGPWALITGASSGIGREFARQVAASGINVVLVARREPLLQEAGAEFSKTYGVEHRIVLADLSEEGFMDRLIPATDDLDIGLVISNAGTASPGEFLKRDRVSMLEIIRLNALSHLEIAHHFGERLARRGRGGLLMSGAMGAMVGLPFMAAESPSKAFIQTLGQALHVEFAPLGVNVTVLVIAPTETAVIAKIGFDHHNMPTEQMRMKRMPVEQCVREGLLALQRNRATHLPGRTNRIANALMPPSIARRIMGKMLGRAVAARSRTAST
ncbi:short-chain dehydrogenase/reductase SDR [Candidatus Koribacter versatilis Ellin345]|uniref:Short-chain dehydrogenase/reductase SDR n=1 Tax=Koribacter versatilis (strain Ellin345) TaxID=204669 RepID=Q1IKM3_KORVE|nr:SDR family NAD(P)-dependent oxidoreductase [Candidatus Koribacter versatilis]ABF42577.1 short-chain dehydrogenase/reductase SDR [Candidatus Koribacter versatilis Ellin345]